jgi:hypothetical protein
MISYAPRQSKGDTKKTRALRTGPRNLMKTRRKAKLAVGSEKTGRNDPPGNTNFARQKDEDMGARIYFAQKVHIPVRFRSTLPFCS